MKSHSATTPRPVGAFHRIGASRFNPGALLRSFLGCILIFGQPAAGLAAQAAQIETAGIFQDFFSGSAGRVVVALASFALIAVFLRLLYGPRGFCRKNLIPADAKNGPAGPGRRGREAETALRRETAIFESYAAEFFSGETGRDAMCRLKLEHSRRVLENALEIAAAESGRTLPPEHAPLLALAALYHDLGRFEQLRRFGTFRDADSINHGRLGSQLLRNKRFLAALDRRGKGLVRLAVLMHNRRRLPAGLPPGLIPLCQALREADQLDILGIMRRELEPGRAPDPTVTLGLPDVAAAYTPAVLQKALAGESVDYADMRYLNDFRILLCTWPGRMRFTASLSILTRQGHVGGILSGLPDTAVFAPLRANLAGLLKTSGP